MKKVHIKVLSLLVLLASGVSSVFAQQDPHFTQYTYNQAILNPAYISTSESLTAGLLVRSQWVGIEGAPKTATFSINGPVGKNVGVGLSIVHNEAGPAKENNIFIDFAYTLSLGDNRNLALGLKGGYTLLDVGQLDPDSKNDPLNVPVSSKEPNFGVGVFYYTDKFYLGAALPNFLETKHLETSDGNISSSAEVSHMFLTSGYVFDLNDRLKLKPSAMVKATIGAPLSIDLSLNLLIDKNLELGLSHRFEDSVSAIIGFNITPDFRIGYAYDYTLTELRDYNSGSHEIMLSYVFQRQRIKSPRFF